MSSTFPGPISESLLTELNQYVICHPQPFVLDLEQCEGMWLATVDGQRLFDWAGYYGSKLIGHNHPRLSEPAYLKNLVLAANNKVANPDFLTPQCLDYYRMLYRLAPEIMRNSALEVYSVNSGAEAVENMMKYLIAKFNQKRAAKGAVHDTKRFVYFENAFHGRTLFALAITQTVDPVATKDFQGLTSSGNVKLHFPHVDNDRPMAENVRICDQVLTQLEALFAIMADQIVAVIVEPLQGAGGQRVALPEFFRGLSQLCHRFDVYLGFDEVQTGLGATGRLWGLDHFDLPYPPMAIAAGKKFGTGAIYMLEPLDDIGVLDSTWGGTLADMVRVVQEVRVVEEEHLIERAAGNGEFLAVGLRRIVDRFRPLAFNVRGLGLYQGFSLDSPERRGELIKAAREEENLLLLGAGRASIRTRPSLSVTQQDIELFLEKLEACLAYVS